MDILEHQINDLKILKNKLEESLKDIVFEDDKTMDIMNRISEKMDKIKRCSQVSCKQIEELKSIIDVLKVHQGLSIKLNKSGDILEIMKILCKESLKINFCCGAAIYFYNKDKKQLKKVLSIRIGKKEEEKIKNVSYIKSIPSENAKRNFFVMPYIGMGHETGQEFSLVLTPLITNGLIFAVNIIKAKKSIVELFDNTLEIIQNMADMTSYVINNNRLLKKNELLSVTDVLTGLFNSRYLDQLLFESNNRHWIEESPVSLIFLDLDGFKAINDHYGHKMGSTALVEVAHIIKNITRDYLTFRYGGDEFVIILQNTDTKKTSEIAEEIRRTIEKHELLTLHGIKAKVTASIGLSTFPNLSSSPGKLFSDADTMMYMAKEQGKNRIVRMKKQI